MILLALVLDLDAHLKVATFAQKKGPTRWWLLRDINGRTTFGGWVEPPGTLEWSRAPAQRGSGTLMGVQEVGSQTPRWSAHFMLPCVTNGWVPFFEHPPVLFDERQSEGCKGTVKGQIPLGFKPDLLGVETLVQTFKIDNPNAYARTVFIEALQRAGVTVNTNLIGQNPKKKLPTEGSYTPETLVAEFISLPFSETIKLVLKVSHNYGANLNLILFGVTQGVKTVQDALEVERETLINDFGISGNEFDFPTNGSGSPDSQASADAIIKLLKEMKDRDVFTPYFDSLPILGVDGSLATVGMNSPPEPPNPIISQAYGQVYAKTGTSAKSVDQEIFLVAQNFAGYLDSKQGKRLAYVVIVNNVGVIGSINDILRVFDDQGKISALIFKEN